MNLLFRMPTKIIMDNNCVIKNAKSFESLGKKAIIVTGKNSARANGSLNDVLEALKINNQDYVLFDKIMANPTIDIVYEGANVAKEENAEFLIAIGGGSPMDAGKAIALLSKQDIKRENLFKGGYSNEILPMVFIPTTAGTGSEVTIASILTDDVNETKSAIANPILAPTIALLDSKYLKSLSQKTMINTVIDALSHLIEGYINKKTNKLIDTISLEGIKVIGSKFENLKNNEFSDDDLDLLMYASNLAGIVIAHTGTTAVHAMGYSLTYFRHIDHGRANGLLLYNYLKYIYDRNKEKIDSILKAMKMASLEEFKEKIDELLMEKECANIEELKKYSKIAIKAKNILACPDVLTEEDLFEIYKKSFSGR